MPNQLMEGVTELLGGVGCSAVLENPLWFPFSDEAVSFCEALSSELLADSEARALPDVVAFAYWLRSANIQSMRQCFMALPQADQRMGAGSALHIAPANIDTVFVYSSMLSYLLGMPTVTRVSARLGLSAIAIVKVIKRFGSDERLRGRLSFIQYEHDNAITANLSDLCGLRVIWGGDQTIQHIQSIELNTPCNDICFPDRYSAILLDADKVLKHELQPLVSAIDKDISALKQQACSSPRLIYWLGSGSAVKAAKDKYWAEFEKSVEVLELTDEECYQRQLYLQLLSIAYGRDCNLECYKNWLVINTELKDQDLIKSHPGLGILVEARIDKLEDLEGLLFEHFQTMVSNLDKETIAQSIELRRIVKPGKALEFNCVWDGVNLLSEMTTFN